MVESFFVACVCLCRSRGVILLCVLFVFGWMTVIFSAYRMFLPIQALRLRRVMDFGDGGSV